MSVPVTRPARSARSATSGNRELTAGSDEAARLRTAVTRLARRLRPTAAAGYLTVSEVDVLGTVARRGPVRLSDLASLAGLNPTMLSRVVAKLENLGLLERRVDDGDRRVSLVHVTAAGSALHERVRCERTDVLSKQLTAMPSSARRALYEALPALELLAERLLSEGSGHELRAGRLPGHDLRADQRAER
ncbi:MAG: MarR family transcriptional regulator [Actinomycetota bacterium]|nr:MarR family transcriptional regulator [Actinomycetota bacterium]